jgi:tripartite-type tricarboxylate transporter receptor subunit TctC
MRRLLLMMLLCLSCIPAAGRAASYPDKPVTIVVPYPPGGGVDFVGRLLATGLSRMGQPVVVENRAGAGGTIGAAFVAHAQADGYTLLVGGTGPLSVGPLLTKNLPYSPLKDLEPISLVVLIPQILVVRPSLPVNSVAELLALARAKPGSLTMGSGGIGTGQHLAGAMLNAQAHVDIRHIPYKGTSLAVNDLLGGHIDMMFADPSVIPMITSGQLRPLGLTTPKRSPLMPGVPTIGETIPGYAMQSFYALAAPAGTPGAVVDKISQALAAMLAEPDIQQKLAAEGMAASPTSPAAAREFIAQSTAHAAQLLGVAPPATQSSAVLSPSH